MEKQILAIGYYHKGITVIRSNHVLDNSSSIRSTNRMQRLDVVTLDHQTIMSLLSAGKCPICKQPLPNNRFYCSRECQRHGEDMGIVVYTGQRKSQKKANRNYENGNHRTGNI